MLPPDHRVIVPLRQRLHEVVDANGFESGEILELLLAAREYVLARDYEGSYECFAKAEHYAMEKQFRNWAVKMRLVLGEIEMSDAYHAYVDQHGAPETLNAEQLAELRKRVEPVRVRFASALELAREVKMSAYTFEALIHLAFAEYQTGDVAAAKQHIVEADELPYKCFRAWVLRDKLYRYAVMVFADEPNRAIQYANRLVSEEHVLQVEQAAAKETRYQQLLAAARDEFEDEFARHQQAEGALVASRDLAVQRVQRLRSTLLWVAAVLSVLLLSGALAWTWKKLRRVRLELTTQKEDARINREMRVVLQERVNRLQRMESLGMLAGGVAHDFNNLLVGVIGNAEILNVHAQGIDELGKECVEQILASAEKAADLSRQMLAYAGKQQIDRKPLEINALISDMRRVLLATVGDAIELTIDVSSEPLYADVDATQIEQVILNLVSNARQACEEVKARRVPRVKISTSTEFVHQVSAHSDLHGNRDKGGDFACIDVIDSGSGFDTVELDRIFEPFYSVSDQGRGLGLSVVYGIVNGHDGLIRVRSTPEEGTLFRVLLPRVDAAAKGGTVEESMPERAEQHGRQRGAVLVIDDEQTVRALTSSLLEIEGWEVVTVADGRSGLKLLKQNADKFDCVLLDVTMPELGATEILPMLKEQQIEVPVILMSGYSNTQLAQFREDKQVSDVISKPFRVNELVEVLGRAIEQGSNAQRRNGQGRTDRVGA